MNRVMPERDMRKRRLECIETCPLRACMPCCKRAEVESERTQLYCILPAFKRDDNDNNNKMNFRPSDSDWVSRVSNSSNKLLLPLLNDFETRTL